MAPVFAEIVGRRQRTVNYNQSPSTTTLVDQIHLYPKLFRELKLKHYRYLLLAEPDGYILAYCDCR